MEDKQVSIRISLTTYKALEKLGKVKDLTISQLIRGLIRDLLARK